MEFVTLISCDGLSKEVSYKTARCAQVLKSAIEACESADNKDIIIPLPEVKGTVLTEVFQWCEKNSSSTSDGFQEAEISVIANWARKPTQPADIHRLFEIIEAANYLDVEDLVVFGCKIAASLISDMILNGTRRPTLQDELLGLPFELLDMILKQLPRYDYLKYIARLPLRSVYFFKKVEQELTIEMGNLESTKERAAADLTYVIEGWNTDNAKCAINHCQIPNVNSIPGWHANNWAAPDFITDGLYILLGSGFEDFSTNLVIFDVVNARKTIIQATELNKIGWPTDPEEIGIHRTAFHSGLIINGGHGEPLRCFELSPSASALEITRIYPHGDFLSICLDIGKIAINKEFICVTKYYRSPKSSKILLFSRDFVLKGVVETPHTISQLYIRGWTIVGLTDRNYSVEYWQIKDTQNLQTSITHFRSVLISDTEVFSWTTTADLGLSHNPDTYFATDRCRFYRDHELAAKFTLDSHTRFGCLDMLSAQYFTVYRFERASHTTIFRFEIYNARLLKEARRISISVAKNDLGEFLGCTMCFTSIILFFSSGVARLALEDNTSIYKRAVLNSSSLLVRTLGVEERKDLP